MGAVPGERPHERRQAERRALARRSSQSVLRQIVDNLADGIVVVGGDGCIRFANPAAERLFGRSADDLSGHEFGYPLTGSEAAEIEIVARGADAVIVAELRVVDSVWEDEPATLVSLRDVTDRKQAEDRERQLERERAARAEAEASNQAKTEFLAVMSHELRTPLNAVLGYAELLDLGVAGSLSAEQRQQLGRITASGRHLLSLVNEILDFAKVEAGHLTVEHAPAPVAETVDAAVVLAQPQAEAHGLALEVQPQVDRALNFVGDRERVVQILANLLSNAVKFTRPGGDIRVSVTRERVGVTRHLHGDQGWVVITVRDTGIGIASEQHEAIFAAFAQVQGGHTRERDGTGLGLTVSRRLARLMNGDVVVDSAPGKGSRFALWLPEAGVRSDADAPHTGEHERMPAVLPPRARGLSAYGDTLLYESECILDAFVTQLREEQSISAAASLRSSQLRDHIGSMLADIAAALVALDESAGAPSSLLHDSAEIQRLIADRHGLQRARLGWSVENLAREHVILLREIDRVMRRRFADGPDTLQLEEAIGIIGRYLEQAEETARRALRRALRQAAAPA